jgi:hypothetical protein
MPSRSSRAGRPRPPEGSPPCRQTLRCTCPPLPIGPTNAGQTKTGTHAPPTGMDGQPGRHAGVGCGNRVLQRERQLELAVGVLAVDRLHIHVLPVQRIDQLGDELPQPEQRLIPDPLCLDRSSVEAGTTACQPTR